MIKLNQENMKEEPIQDEKKEQEKQKAEKQALVTLTLGQNPTEEFNSILMKEFKEMNGSTEEKIKRLFNRLQKFFLRDKGARINIRDGYFCKKRQPFYQLKGIHVVDNQIILFGVDFAKHRDIIRAYQPDSFFPVDMSHVKLVYGNFFEAMDALRRNQREGVQENSMKLEPNIHEPPKGWMEMKPYYISNYERRVLARFATSEELEVINTRKIQSNIPLFAKKVYDLKKKESQDIQENFRLREEKLQIKKLQKRQKRGNSDNSENYDRANSTFNDQTSQKSYTLNIGMGKGNRDDDKSSVSYRERSRDKDFDKESVVSKKSSLSSLAGNLANNLGIEQKDERDSVVSDASFILDHNDDNEEVFRDMAMRLGLMNMEEKRQDSFDQSYEHPQNEKSFVSSLSSENYRLTENMPDNKDQSHDQSIAKKPWKYSEWNDKQQRLEEKKRRQEKEVVIVLDD